VPNCSYGTLGASLLLPFPVAGNALALEKLLLAGWDINQRALPHRSKHRQLVCSRSSSSDAGSARRLGHGRQLSMPQPPVVVAPAPQPLPLGWAPDLGPLYACAGPGANAVPPLGGLSTGSGMTALALAAHKGLDVVSVKCAGVCPV
jgi:hypothetical protein